MCPVRGDDIDGSSMVEPDDEAADTSIALHGRLRRSADVYTEVLRLLRELTSRRASGTSVSG